MMGKQLLPMNVKINKNNLSTVNLYIKVGLFIKIDVINL